MAPSSSLWPRMYAVIRIANEASASSPFIPEIVSVLAASGIESRLVDQINLVADISYLQNVHGSAESAVAQLQHLLNLQISPLEYSLGIGNEQLLAFHAAQLVPPGHEKWILPRELADELDRIPVSALTVLDKHMPEFFHSCGKQFCSQLHNFGKLFLTRRFSYAGEVLWYLLRGKSRQFPVQERMPDGDMLWRLALPVRTRSKRALSAHLWNLYLTVGRNLDSLNRQAEHLKVQYQTTLNFNKPHSSANFSVPVMLKSRLKQRRQLSEKLQQMNVNNKGITHLQITASGLTHPAGQLDLF